MAITKLSEVEVGAVDYGGEKIKTIYALDLDLYAVYRTDKRIVIQYCDRPDEERRQRARLAKIQAIRGQINGLIDGWRTSRFPGDKSKAARFDRRGADALVMALEGYPEDAASALDELKQDILEDRTSWARFLYLIASAVLAAIAVLIAFKNTHGLNDTDLSIFECNTWPLFFAAAAGAVGAFFSIAIAIHNRTILTDQNLRDNTADALLRILIGVVSAVALMCLLYSHVVTFDAFINRVDVGSKHPVCFEYSWSTVISIAFIAGFSERFVPDLLARTETTLAANAAPPPGGAGKGPAPAPAPAPGPPAGGRAAARRLARRLGLGGGDKGAADSAEG